MSKARITYRYNNESQERIPERDSTNQDRVEVTPSPTPSITQSQSQSKVIPMYQENPVFMERDYGAWRSPFDAETERIEQLIRNSETNTNHIEGPNIDRETPAYYTAPQAEQTFQNVNFYDELPVRTTYRKKGKTTNWFSLTTSITGAILTGIVLGMFVLSMFRGEANPVQSTKEPAAIDNGSAAVLDGAGEIKLDAVEDKGTISGIENQSASLTAIAIPEQTYFLIQNGVFSSLEGANIAVQQLKDMGLSGAVNHSDQFSVFAGAALLKEDALLLSHYLQNESLEVFIKPYVLPAVKQIAWVQQEGTQVQDYMNKSRSLVDLILGMTATGLQDINESTLPTPDKQLVQQEHKLWTEVANQIEASAPKDVKSIVQQMNKSLNSAILTVEQYDKNPTEVFLWQAQAAVSEHIIAQKQFIDAAMKL